MCDLQNTFTLLHYLIVRYALMMNSLWNLTINISWRHTSGLFVLFMFILLLLHERSSVQSRCEERVRGSENTFIFVVDVQYVSRGRFRSILVECLILQQWSLRTNTHFFLSASAIAAAGGSVAVERACCMNSSNACKKLLFVKILSS